MANNIAAKEKLVRVVDNHFAVKTEEGYAKLEEALNELIKAFGDCTLCYGKGYSTKYNEPLAYDIQSESYLPALKVIATPCICERGEQIKKVFEIQ